MANFWQGEARELVATKLWPNKVRHKLVAWTEEAQTLVAWTEGAHTDNFWPGQAHELVVAVKGWWPLDFTSLIEGRYQG